ncbi:uncharacterized protein EKO05_0004995 [Ascochyta rabiei]|uniref:uncharacterized protein n=1 Tax=Didymella rabiei TaxID=5454 RepID=UPI00220CB14F|nr:uncharacterized protein EKO05_0004995 [Ascochyta rabiei]UPX14516.1 hypothetical protein EKO05_0004995 [Ascochyta rabiei]
MLVLAFLGALMAHVSLGSAALTMRSVSLVVNLAIVTLPGLVSAANNIKMINRCPYDIYSWSVGPVGSGFNGHDHEALTIPANSVTVHGMINTEAIGSGIALKFRDLSKYEVAPAGIIQVEYNLEPSKNNLWYDLSAIDCDRAAGPESPSFCPLVGGGMKLYVAEADEAKCPPAWCGADGCHNTYTRRGSWKGEPTFRCNVGVDIIIEMCTERAGARTFNGNTEPEHAVDSNPDVKAGGTTQNGVCGARDPFGATCFGYTHGNCCSCKSLTISIINLKAFCANDIQHTVGAVSQKRTAETAVKLASATASRLVLYTSLRPSFLLSPATPILNPTMWRLRLATLSQHLIMSSQRIPTMSKPGLYQATTSLHLSTPGLALSSRAISSPLSAIASLPRYTARQRPATTPQVLVPRHQSTQSPATVQSTHHRPTRLRIHPRTHPHPTGQSTQPTSLQKHKHSSPEQ